MMCVADCNGKVSLCDYSDAYIIAKGTISVEAVPAAATNNDNKKIIFNRYAPFTDNISKKNNTEVDNVKDIEVVISTYNLIEYSDNYSKTSASLWKYYRDEPVLNSGTIVGFTSNNKSDSFN